MAALVADVVAFNSAYNRDSFLKSLNSLANMVPDHKPRGIADRISAKCIVLYYPVFPAAPPVPQPRGLKFDRIVRFHFLLPRMMGSCSSRTSAHCVAAPLGARQEPRAVL